MLADGRVWQVARRLAERHGEHALVLAGDRVDELREQGQSRRAWNWVILTEALGRVLAVQHAEIRDHEAVPLGD